MKRSPGTHGVIQGVAPERLASLALLPVTAAIALGFALVWIPATFFDGTVMPSGEDAFYHARRILDALDAPWRVVQFDTTIHAPEGSWVTWPWGYDAFMALLGGLARTLFGVDPLRALVFVPPAWIVVNAALLLGICRQLALPPLATWIVALCFAMSPLTQNLHAVGAIDHHFFEYTFVLATLLAGLRSFGAPASAGAAAILGTVLGVANAVHNGLFLLQLPIVATFGVLWLKGLALERRPALALAAALIAATVAVALPSDALRAGFLSYDLLSWFHVYVACLSALACTLMAHATPSARTVCVIGAILLAASLPLFRVVVAGLGFVTAGMYAQLYMPEMIGPFDALTVQGILGAASSYSTLVFLMPLSLLAAAALVVRSRDARIVLLCVDSLFGGLLLTQQYRFHQFGSFALYLLPIVLLQQLPWAGRRKTVAFAVTGLLAVLAILPALPRLLESPPPGGNYDLALTLPLYRTLAERCREHPGIVLGDNNDGHYIRFFTRCSVISNNLVLSEKSWEKLHQAIRLLDLEPQRMQEEAPWVRYVLVRRDDNIFDSTATPADVLRQNSTLRRALLLPGGTWPASFELLDERRVRIGTGPDIILARLFAVR